MKCQTFFTRYTDTWLLGPTASADTREFRIGLGLAVFEVGLCFKSEKPFGYGCGGCSAIGQAPVDQLPPGWEKRHRSDSSYYFLCPKCIEEGREVDGECTVTAVDEIVRELAGVYLAEAKVLRAYAIKLLGESEPFLKADLAAALAAYSDGFTDAEVPMAKEIKALLESLGTHSTTQRKTLYEQVCEILEKKGG